MVTKGLLVRLEAQHGKDADVEDFLRGALPAVQGEPGTAAWFAVRFGRSEYGIFDVFPDDEARTAHLNGAVAQALGARGDALFASPPKIVRLDVLAAKLPAAQPPERVEKGLLLTFAPKSEHDADVADFLRGAQALVEEEERTTAWFAIRLEDGHFGIFDVFPDNRARFAHLTGKVPRELAKHATALLGGFPDMTLLNVLETKLG